MWLWIVNVLQFWKTRNFFFTKISFYLFIDTTCPDIFLSVTMILVRHNSIRTSLLSRDERKSRTDSLILLQTISTGAQSPRWIVQLGPAAPHPCRQSSPAVQLTEHITKCSQVSSNAAHIKIATWFWIAYFYVIKTSVFT